MTDRALFHCDNAYFYPAVQAKSAPLYTNTVSNTAFRGFGGPQGMVGAERVIDEIAFALGKDPLEIRKLNFYGTATEPQRHALPPDGRGQHHPPHRRRAGGRAPTIRRGARRSSPSTPTAAIIKQRHRADAGEVRHLVHRHRTTTRPARWCMSITDGSVHLNHGGTEMGQGLYIKVAQVVAEEFQIDLDQVKITATTTGKVPNTSATAASSGTDLNGMAAQDAARQIKERLIDFAADKYQVPTRPGRVPAEPGAHRQPGDRLRRSGQAGLYGPRPALGRRLLQDAENPLGPRQRARATRSTTSPMARPCSEVSIDTLTGEYHGRARRHPARCRPLAEPGDRSSARSRAASSRAWAG